MKENIWRQTITENSNGVEKGSSKRVIAYLFALVICFISVYAVIKDSQNIPLQLIALLITNLLILLGIGAVSAKINPPAVPPSGNLDKAKDIVQDAIK